MTDFLTPAHSHANDVVGDHTIRLEPRSAFETVRALLTRAQFDEATVSRRLGCSVVAFVRLFEGRRSMHERVEDAGAALIRLFMDGESLPHPLARTLFGDAAIDAMFELSMLRRLAGDEDLVVATIQLVPIYQLWLASDVRPRKKDESDVRQDFVFSPNNELTTQYLAAVTRQPRGRFLELCAGSGVAGLRALRDGAERSVLSDLVPRAVLYERFNALLNGLEDRCDIVQGDAWSAIEGEFDLAVAHPPYIPALAHRFDFRDAGADGEQVTRAIIEGAPAHIRRGGSLIVRSSLSERTTGKIADRVRQWLGESSPEFDLVQIDVVEYGPMEAYLSITKGGPDLIDCERWLRHFRALGVERFSICTIELRRTAFGRAPVTIVRKVGHEMTPEVFDWLFRWGEHLVTAGATPVERMTSERPRVNAGARLAIHLEAGDDLAWRNIGAMVESNWPTHEVVKAPPLIPTLLELCDGTRDLRALFAGLDSAGLIDGEVSEAQFAGILEILASAGVLEVASCPLPRRSRVV